MGMCRAGQHSLPRADLMLVADFVGATRLGIKGLEMSRHATQPRAVLGTVDMHGAPTSPAPYRPRAADVFNHLATATTFGGGEGGGRGGHRKTVARVPW